MKVFKFGGASVRDAESVRNVARIIRDHNGDHPVVVISAMGKMTNALEKVAEAWFARDERAQEYIQGVRSFHGKIMQELFREPAHPVYSDVETLFTELEVLCGGSPPDNFGMVYDKVVSFGELISTRIISHFLALDGLPNEWLDARHVICTNSIYRSARINWERTTEKARKFIPKDTLCITQGFIGANEHQNTTTLGREGSDYTASVLCYVLEGEEVVIWKDVPGVLNGDPKVFEHTVLLQEISYTEAIELAYYGASVIHPKTIQPLQRREIPLRVKSFLKPDVEGTVISKGRSMYPAVPCFIRKTGQFLITLSTRDLAFIVEDHMSIIYRIFSRHGVKVNMMQNSAVSTSFCINHDPLVERFLLDDLQEEFSVKPEGDLTLFTVRHYDEEAKWRVKLDKDVLMEQITPETYQVVVREK